MMDGANHRFELRNRTGQHVVVDEDVVSFREIRNLMARCLITVERNCIESAVRIGPGIRIRTAQASHDIIVAWRPSKVARLQQELMQALGFELRPT
jgi:hypothetical protein